MARFSFLLLLAVPACGQVTGLTDDYRFDADAGQDGGAPASDSGAPDAGTDASDGGATRAQCTQALNKSGGENLSSQCRQCITNNCCDQVSSCGGNQNCADSMSCVLQCQKASGNKEQCVKDCNGSFLASQAGGCVATQCAANCALAR